MASDAANDIGGHESAIAARQMVRLALKGALATADATHGTPYASMILLATSVEGAPLTLVSNLARHTRNLKQSSAASILVDTSDAIGDPATGGRISLMGRFAPDASRHARARFLARHPAAADYADFADFGFFRFEIDSAHLIEGFGRIVPLDAAALRAPPVHDLSAFAAAEPAAVADLRRRWPLVTGFDSEGVDLVASKTARRLRFATPCLDLSSAQAAAANCLAMSGDR